MQFGIPIGLIAPQLGDVLAATAFLFTVALFLSFIVFLYRLVRPKVPVSPAEALVVCAFIPMALLMLLLSAGDPDQGFTPWFASGLLIVALLAAITLRSGIFRNRLEKDTLRTWDSLRGFINRGRTIWVALGMAVVVILLVFAYAIGGEQARNQLIFLVSDPANPEVELAIYGDTVVLAPIDRSTHMVRPEFDIVKIGPTPLHLRYENIGPLKTDKKLIIGV